MASCVRNIPAKNYQNLVTAFQVTVENVGDVFLRHSVVVVVAVHNNRCKWHSAEKRRTVGEMHQQAKTVYV